MSDEFAGLPLWIWMDDPSFYGFPTYGERTVKAAQDTDVSAFRLDRQALTQPDYAPHWLV